MRTSSVLRSRHTPLSRSNQCVDSHAPASRIGAHQANRTSTIADASPPTISTSPLAMKSMLIERGGPVIPRSKSRAIVRSFVSSGRSRCPMPGGRVHASIMRS